jgi:hypothetical protein
LQLEAQAQEVQKAEAQAQRAQEEQAWVQLKEQEVLKLQVGMQEVMGNVDIGDPSKGGWGGGDDSTGRQVTRVFRRLLHQRRGYASQAMVSKRLQASIAL